MARIDHFNDPRAPAANSIVVAITAFVIDDSGRVLLIHRTDNDLSGFISTPITLSNFRTARYVSSSRSASEVEPSAVRPRPSDESSEVRWVAPDVLAGLNIHPSMRLRITRGYDRRAEPYIG